MNVLDAFQRNFAEFSLSSFYKIMHIDPENIKERKRVSKKDQQPLLGLCDISWHAVGFIYKESNRLGPGVGDFFFSFFFFHSFLYI